MRLHRVRMKRCQPFHDNKKRDANIGQAVNARADDAIETFRMSIWKIELKQKRRWAELENQERLLTAETVVRKKSRK